ncbi:MAG: methionyl-tRNA formyltransferase [Candidatus Liptonbacteria bacterium]|nr:methionyl-tRNA formyltransferase [Candidatus Liptonbacteria bacterium]
MNYVFFGTPRFASIILQKLIDADTPPVLVVCNPDKPVGRKKVITAPETKIIAEKNVIPVLQPEKLSDADFENLKSKILNLKCDIAVVAAYAKIIPKEVIELFPNGIIGVHPSLLPKHRGPSPIQQAILDGDKETGVTLYVMDEKVDRGPIISDSRFKISDLMTYTELEEKLAYIAGELLVGVLPNYIEGKIKPKEQNHAEATFTKKFTTEDGFVDLAKDKPELITRKIRALNPEPGVYIVQNEKRLKLLEVKLLDGKWVITKSQLEGKVPKENKIFLSN